jgi:hypothetical protein
MPAIIVVRAFGALSAGISDNLYDRVSHLLWQKPPVPILTRLLAVVL